MFKLIPNFSLKDHNSFGLDVSANYWLSLTSVEDWGKAMIKYPHLLNEKRLIIGGGTNLLFMSDYDGLIISPDFCGFSIAYQDNHIVEIRAGSGEEWDDFVAYCVEKNWYGVENLSQIPGKVGATPVQNIGAYGCEAESVIVRVDGINLKNNSTMSYSQEQCRFSYRSSIFKEQLANLFMVTSVTFRLQKQGELVSGYGDLKKMILEFGEPSPDTVRKAVTKIRSSKLPDPKKQGNAGSFFKNPIVTEEVAAALNDLLPGLPVYQMNEGFVKISAGFLIEKAGWKGYESGQVAVHERQALVIVNKGGATGPEILALSQAIMQDVFEKYGVMLEREVQVVEE